MKKDLLANYVSIRRQLEKELQECQARGEQLKSALAGGGEIPIPFSRRGRGGPKGKAGGRKPARRGKRNKNSISLREAVLQVTKGKPVSRQEILAAVKNLGFKFNTKDPLNSIGTILYGKKPKFKNTDGKFSLK